jgi:YVTN family beta-propeller protein
VTNFLYWLMAAVVAQTVTDGGIVVGLDVSKPRAGDSAHVEVTLRDQTTGAPLGGVFPTAWFANAKGDSALDRKQCTASVATFIAGNVYTRPAVDLNVYHVVAMNGDATLTVVDPHFSFGGTQLLALLELPSTGFDWVLSGTKLFVTSPGANKVTAIDTSTWKILSTFDAGADPRRIIEQPDAHYVWITTSDGVTALRPADLTIAAKIKTGNGPHDLVATPDNRSIIVTNGDDGTVSVVDVATLKEVARGPAGAKPVAVDWSPLSNLAYIASSDGAITALDPRARKPVARIMTEPGLERIRFAPGGRYGFTLNPAKDLLHIIDVASNRVIQTGELEGGPFEVTFTDSLAYVRRRDSELVLMVPLANIGTEGRALSVVEFPAGDTSFGKAPRLTAADGIVAAAGENAVLVANPADHEVYFYKEGMAAPIGHFSNYEHPPQAVLVVDRSLREAKPGTFSTTATMPEAGAYDVAVFLDSPRVVGCFRVNVAENPDIAPAKLRVPLDIQHLTKQRIIAAHEKTQLTFRLTDAKTKLPATGLTDARALIMQANGAWSERRPLVAHGDGRYETDFTSPAPGVYYVYIECPSAGLRASNPQFLVLQAE